MVTVTSAPVFTDVDENDRVALGVVPDCAAWTVTREAPVTSWLTLFESRSCPVKS